MTGRRRSPAVGAVGAAAELAVVQRNTGLAAPLNGFVESRHVGHAVVVGPDGNVVAALGDTSGVIAPRSALKPWQALACLQAGADLGPEAIAIAAGSHTGQPDHLDVVETVLAAAGLTTDDLGCPAEMPGDAAARDAWVRAGRGPARVAMNCSGKHAAMLAACVANGWDTTTYLSPAHPLQQQVRDTVTHAVGPIAAEAVDGCGAPLLVVPLLGLATAAGTLARATDGPAARVAEAMRDHPWAVHGHGAGDTLTMQGLPGVVCKRGAEGVMMLGTPDGTGIAVKILDGNDRAALPVALWLLATCGWEVDEVLADVIVPVLGGGERAGSLDPGTDVRALRA